MSANPSHLSDPPAAGSASSFAQTPRKSGPTGVRCLARVGSPEAAEDRAGRRGCVAAEHGTDAKKGPGAFSQGPSVWTARKVRSAGKSGLN